jgi:hypothetical protein
VASDEWPEMSGARVHERRWLNTEITEGGTESTEETSGSPPLRRPRQRRHLARAQSVLQCFTDLKPCPKLHRLLSTQALLKHKIKCEHTVICWVPL